MDGHLRALERAASTGDPAARVSWLCEQRRTGKLTTDRLRLAALAGDDAAQEALGYRPQIDDFGNWGEGLAACGREAAVRALLALARSATARRPDTPDADAHRWARIGPLVEEMQQALRRWILAPHDGTRRVVIRLRDELAATRSALPRPELPTERLLAAARAALHYAGHVVGSNALDQLTEVSANGMLVTCRALLEAGVTEAELRAAVRAALQPWALDEGDPLRG